MTSIEVIESEDKKRTDVKSGLFCIALLARLQGRRISTEALWRHYGHLKSMSRLELASIFQELGFISSEIKTSASKIKSLPLPAVLSHKDGRYAVMLDINKDGALVHYEDGEKANRLKIKELLPEMEGYAIVAHLTEQESKTRKRERFGLWWFFKTLAKYRQIVREMLLASFFIQCFALVTPLVFMIIIDKVFTHNNLSTLDVLVFALIVVTVFDILLGGMRTYLSNHTTSRVDLELGMRFFSHMLSLPLSYFESRRTGDTVARMKEMDTVRHFLTGSSLTLVVDLLFVFVFLFVMYLFSPLLATIVVLSLPLFLLVSIVVTPFMKSRLEDKHEKLAENQSFIVEMLGGVETIKSSACEPYQRQEWNKRMAALSKCTYNSNNLSNFINQTTNLLSKVLTITLLYLGAKLVLNGELSVGQLIAFNMLTGRVVQPILRIAGVWQEFTALKVAIRRLADIMDTPGEPMLLVDRTELPELTGRIKFDHVSFCYDEQKGDVIKDVSFEVKPGEVIGIVGSTGSGKTTLAKLIQRLYVPTNGNISVDGMDICAMDSSWLRRQIGVIAQDFVLFNRSIRDNIVMDDLDITDKQVIDIAKLVGAHEMINRLADGYDTVLQERGLGLSTGQRQLIALARALIGNPPILIFDEATSSLDYDSEQQFQRNFKKIADGRTTIVIAHRLSTVRQADRIITLEDGRLIEDGKPEDLLARGGRFADLAQIHHTAWQSQNYMS